MPKSPIGPIPGQKVAAIGFSWYHEADYAAALAIMADGNVMPQTYAAWLSKSEKLERELTRDGHKVIRAIIDPATFPDWCRRNGFAQVNADARKMWGAEYAARQIGL